MYWSGRSTDPRTVTTTTTYHPTRSIPVNCPSSNDLSQRVPLSVYHSGGPVASASRDTFLDRCAELRQQHSIINRNSSTGSYEVLCSHDTNPRAVKRVQNDPWRRRQDTLSRYCSNSLGEDSLRKCNLADSRLLMSSTDSVGVPKCAGEFGQWLVDNTLDTSPSNASGQFHETTSVAAVPAGGTYSALPNLPHYLQNTVLARQVSGDVYALGPCRMSSHDTENFTRLQATMERIEGKIDVLLSCLKRN